MNAHATVSDTSPQTIHGRKTPRALHMTTKKIVKHTVASEPASFDQPANNPNKIINSTFNAEFPASCERKAFTYGVTKNKWKNDIHI